MNNQPAIERRDNALDVARGITIILVVIGHMIASVQAFADLHNSVYAFHIPFFFFASGLVFNEVKYSRFPALLKRKAKTLIIPYLLFSFLSWLWYVAERIYYAGGFFSENAAQYKEQFFEIFQAHYSAKMAYNPPLWFVLSLFAVELIHFLLKKIKWIPLYWGAVTACVVLGWWLESEYCPIDTSLWPWNICSALYSVGFYALGNSAKPLYAKVIVQNERLRLSTRVMLTVAGGLLIAGACWLGIRNGFVSIGSRVLKNGYLLYLTGLMGTAGILIISKTLSSLCACRYLRFCGRNSFYFMAVHWVARDAVEFAYNLFSRITGRGNLFFGRTSAKRCLVMMVVVMVMSTVFILLYNYVKRKILSRNVATEQPKTAGAAEGPEVAG
ncbi:MAG: acyltransferase family protein [Clostridia bacterium]|nr:acyltransferase family protein [Clostridia bacterium]